MKLQKHMAGRAATTFVTLLVIAIVGVAVFFAVDSMLGGDGEKDQAKADASDTLTADDARRIGREEGAKVARDIAYDVALDVAQNSGAAALYGDSYAAADSGGDSFGDDYNSTDYGSYGGSESSADDDYDSYGAYDDGSTTSSGTSDSGSADAYGSDDYGSDTYGSDSYGSDDYGSDDYGSDDFGSGSSDSSSGDRYDDYASDDYGSDDFGAYSDGTDDDAFASDRDSASDAALDSANSSSAADAPSRRSDPNEPEPPIRGKAPPPAVALKPWWPAAKDQAGGALKVLYAGNFKGNSANGIGVLFSSAVKADQAIGDYIKVLDDSGKAVTPEWTLGNNPALVRSGDLPRGRYLVQLKPGLQSAQGRKQTLSIEGPVFVE